MSKIFWLDFEDATLEKLSPFKHLFIRYIGHDNNAGTIIDLESGNITQKIDKPVGFYIILDDYSSHQHLKFLKSGWSLKDNINDIEFARGNNTYFVGEIK